MKKMTSEMMMTTTKIVMTRLLNPPLMRILTALILPIHQMELTKSMRLMKLMSQKRLRGKQTRRKVKLPVSLGPWRSRL